MLILRQRLTREEADTFGLVLLSSGIAHQVLQGRGGWELWVAEDATEQAEALLQTYLKENRDTQTLPEPPSTPQPKTWSGVWGAFGLLAWHMILVRRHDVDGFYRIYGASASHIVNGEWYRCATALMLHADSIHLLANLAGLAVFATAVCSVSGWGMGWLLTLGAGICGNLVNAYAYGYGHRSIGASTAVFGALGLLSAYQFLKKVKMPGSRFQIWLPLGAGLALLAFLGASAHTDIMAHLFGFLSGVFIGLFYFSVVLSPMAWKWQAGALMGTVSLMAVAWLGPTLS